PDELVAGVLVGEFVDGGRVCSAGLRVRAHPSTLTAHGVTDRATWSAATHRSGREVAPGDRDAQQLARLNLVDRAHDTAVAVPHHRVAALQGVLRGDGPQVPGQPVHPVPLPGDQRRDAVPTTLRGQLDVPAVGVDDRAPV